MTKGKLVLVRHGQTEWAKIGQFTGRTNIPLTAVGHEQAKQAKSLLQEYNFSPATPDQIFVSPLKRAQQTANDAGFANFTTNPLLQEWAYGNVEGYKVAQLSELIGHKFNLWLDGTAVDTSPLSDEPMYLAKDDDGSDVPRATVPGESLEDIAARAREFIAQVDPLLAEGKDILVVAHSHFLRILMTQWIGLAAVAGVNFWVDTASVSEIGYTPTDQDLRAVLQWNKTNGR
jgi:probable phosphoglycerate mutase